MEGGRVHLAYAARDVSELTLSRDVPRGDVLKLFDEAAFAALWEDGFADLEVVSALPEYEGWLATRYSQAKKWTEGYYHDRTAAARTSPATGTTTPRNSAPTSARTRPAASD